jgi:hypothetical protein
MHRRYAIESPTSAVAIQRTTRAVITVPRASIIQVAQAVDTLHGLIEATLNGETVLMFAEDIRQRGKLLPELAPVAADAPGGNKANE